VNIQIDEIGGAVMSGIDVRIPIEVLELGRGRSVGCEIGPCSLKSMVKPVVGSQGSVAHFGTDLACGP
jgi:hypothetical protein